MRGGITDEDTSHSPRSKFFRGGGREVRIVQASKDPKMGEVWVHALENLEGHAIMDGGGAPIEEVGGSCEGLGPVRWHGSMKEQCAGGVV